MSIDIADIMTKVAAFMSLFGTAILIIKSFRTLPKEIKKVDKEVQNVDIELSQKYKKLADDAFSEAERYRKERDEFRRSIEACSQKTDELEVLIKGYDEYVVELIAGLDILIRQLKRARITPQWDVSDADQYKPTDMQVK